MATRLRHDTFITQANYPQFVDDMNAVLNRRLYGDHDLDPTIGKIAVEPIDDENYVVRYVGNLQDMQQVSAFTGKISAVTNVVLSTGALAFQMAEYDVQRGSVISSRNLPDIRILTQTYNNV